MKRTALLTSAALAAFQVHYTDLAEARPGRGNAFSAISYPGCPYGTSHPLDGCQVLYDMGLQGTVQYSDCFTNPNCGPGSGQTGLDNVTPGYKSRLQENQIGVDFPGGRPANRPALKDPNIPANVPAHCTFNLTGGSGGVPKMTCGGGPVLIQDIEFGPIGGHGSTILALVNTVSGTATGCILPPSVTSTPPACIEFNHFKSDPGMVAASNANDYWMGIGLGGSTFSYFLGFNTIDGNCIGADLACGDTGGCCSKYTSITSGEQWIEYNAFLLMAVRLTLGPGGNSTLINVGNLHANWNFVLSHDVTPALHGEFIENIPGRGILGVPATIGTTEYIGDVIIERAVDAPQTTANIYVSAGANPLGPMEYGHVRVSDGTSICNISSSYTPANTPICSANMDFQNGTYADVVVERMAFDSTGTYGGAIRTDCAQNAFTGSIDTSGILTVTGSLSSLQNAGDIVANTDTGSSRLYFGGAQSGIRLVSQRTSTSTQHVQVTGATITSNQLHWTGTLTGSGLTFADMISGTGVPPGVVYISSCGSQCWNVSSTPNISTPFTATTNLLARDGTYQTDDVSGIAKSSQQMYSYGSYGAAAFPNGMTVQNNINMLLPDGSNAISKVDYHSGCFITGAPSPPM